jgi:hypothetical protein
MKPVRYSLIRALCAWLVAAGLAWGFASAPAAAQPAAAPDNQRRLLEQSIAALAPRDPAKINMYLLAVAGDGAQEVFRREVEFVRKQFTERFDMQGQTLALINSRNTIGRVPMATRESLDEALRAIAARMDTQQDILFLFLTSHGSQDHVFSLAHPRRKLRGLPAKLLGNLLRESGIRWKVVVVSACYSGGFIDVLKDDGTLVITAARHDRSSFGCSDENDFTFFGRAFFSESLPRAQSFEEAFAKATTLVREWEDKEQNTGTQGTQGIQGIQGTQGPDTKAGTDHYSYPQMVGAAPIRQHLQRWWRQQHRSQKTE